ncbi:TIGR02680 family protein [Egibacter rhizosphaerae]|uniref:TIGR02680 family protein n=1 Tax=Egibacter rhizosphaerae TaxID=1670831 RepID=A0A411YI04_9ACTN|nr:TIGR02680 family protein [Egibacter rhizosphaerae]QBI20870.1 TIGR02680 family protein [Egibacter rhizosphaerae]
MSHDPRHAAGDGQLVAHTPEPPAELPAPTRTRWQPLRLGLVDVFHYDHQELWFRDGRLLLRGNNGTGKSKVLALTLPFLLDGEVAPHRVEPDGDPGKRMEWNLLLDGAYAERTGYVWLEFGRIPDEPGGEPETLTLGCGLKATHGKGAPARWFFATRQRVGRDLWLVSSARTAKTKERLAESLDGTGRLLEQPGAWRRLVDETLFGLGPERYEALLRLLIQLRQPQLSRRPDEEALSAALTEALAPPDQDLVHDVAEAFRSLETDRADLAALAEARDEVAEFAQVYSATAGIAARRAAGAVTSTNATYERLSGERSTAERERAEAERAEQAAAAEVAQADTALAETRAEQQALRDSRTMDDARALEREDELADQAQRRADEAADRAAQTASDRDEAAEALASAETTREQARAELDAALAEADEAADVAGVDAAHRSLLAEHPDDDGAARQAADALAARRREQVAHVRGLADTAVARDRDAAEARRRRDEGARDRDRAAEDEQEATDALARVGGELAAAVRAWSAGLAELVADGEALEADVAAWAESGTGDDPLGPTIAAAHRTADTRLAEEDAHLAARDAELGARRDELASEREGLVVGAAPTPPVPHTRDEAAREHRPGAPLWQLVDFADGMADDERAGLEAALEAGGLLDAWLTPDGALLDPDLLDVVLAPSEATDPPSDADANRALVPAATSPDGSEPAVPAATVHRALSAIGLGPATAPTWVATDGRYRVGPLEGRWAKPSAAYVGHAAREASRRARLVELDDGLATLDAERDELGGQREHLAIRREQLDAEASAAPSPRPVFDAHTQLAERTAARARLDRRVDELDRAVADADERARQARADRDEAAADLSLPGEPGELDAARQHVDAYALAARSLWPARAAHRGAAATREREFARHERLAATATTRFDEAAAARREADAARRRADTLRAQVGAAVTELTERLDEVARRIEELEAQRQQADAQRSAHHDETTRLAERVRGLGDQVEAAEEDRRGAVDAFQQFAATGLLTAATPDLDAPDPNAEAWAADPAVRLARRVNAALEEVDAGDEAWQRADTRLLERFGQLQEALGAHDYRPELRREAGAPVIDIAARSERLSPATLAERLRAQIAEREQLLTSRERELLETHLIDQAGEHLAARVHAADQQVAAINEQLAQRPTSTGMTLRLEWAPRADAPAGLKEARQRLLRQRVEAWSDEGRAAVGGFLQDQIAAVRAAREGGRWEEHLAEALDYRRWHAFAIQRKTPTGWRRATGPASGGERALAATVPMLAAAASFYGTAGRDDAPRPIMLDEVFAGIDDDARAKCLGLLAEFDLDVVATSEREWGCYPTVPGLAIAQLARVDGIDAVHVSHWEWDGAALAAAERPTPPLAEPAEPAEPEA